jgi:hypothetical protein
LSRAEALTAVAAMRVKRIAVTFIVKEVWYIERDCLFEIVDWLGKLDV